MTKAPDYSGVAHDLREIYISHNLAGSPIGKLIRLTEQECKRLASGATGPDLSHHDPTQLRSLKRRIRRAKEQERGFYRGVAIASWVAAITLREKQLGIGTRGGRPPEAL